MLLCSPVFSHLTLLTAVLTWKGVLSHGSISVPSLPPQIISRNQQQQLHMCCVSAQVASEQRRHKISYHLQRSSPEADAAVLQQLRDSLAAAGLAAKVIYSGGLDVDILAQGAGKGKALEFILKELKEAGAYPPDGVQVCFLLDRSRVVFQSCFIAIF